MPPGKSTADDMPAPRLLRAVDDAGGSILCTYTDDDTKSARAMAPQRTARAYGRALLDVFLPSGYPHSVGEDYTAYQVYDTLQAFSSTVAGLLAARAQLQGLGVGDGASSATAAILLTVAQETSGRAAAVAFAHRAGRAVDPECKRYRLLADLLNAAAMVLDLVAVAAAPVRLLLFSSLFSAVLPLPPAGRVAALCAAGVLRALCGVSAGAAKASLSAHFARRGNLAELNAKDGSQETVVSLVGLAAGSAVVRAVEGPDATAACMAALLAAHLYLNVRAVRAVTLRSLNRQRASLVLAEYTTTGRVLRPDEVAVREVILSWHAPARFATAYPPRISPAMLRDLARHGYIVVLSSSSSSSSSSFAAARHVSSTRTIYLRAGATPRVALQAWFFALAGLRLDLDDPFWKALASAGWDLDTAALETGTPVRLVVDDGDGGDSPGHHETHSD